VFVGIVRIELHLPASGSLKAKRSVIRSLKERIRVRVHAAVAEVDHQDSWQRAAVGVAMISNDPVHVHSCLDRIVDFVRQYRGLSMIDYEKNLY